MNPSPTGGSAFPFQHEYPDGERMFCMGLSIRDYFAGQALAGIMVNTDMPDEAVAEEAYAVADAMITRGQTLPAKEPL